MDGPLVSICIPNYNNAKYLDACIQSAINQEYKNVEIVFSDDKSTDESLKIAQKYSDSIKISTNPTNLGQPKNTNRSIELSSGKYVVILHSDDALLPNFARDLVPLLEQNSNLGMAVGERILTDENDDLTEIAPFYNTNCIVPGLKQAKVFLMTAFLPCQVLVRREILNTIGGVDERHIVNLDGLLWFTCCLAGDMAYIQDPVCLYRIHSEQTTAQYNRTINHMMEYFGTLSQMFKLAQGKPYLEQFFAEATKRTAQLTVRYCHDILKEKNYDLARRYLTLALVFDPEIVEHEPFIVLNNCLSSTDGDPYDLYAALADVDSPRDRGFSYDPPEGFELFASEKPKAEPDIFHLLKNKKIIIYGAGKIGKRVFQALEAQGFETAFFWDINAGQMEDHSGTSVNFPDFRSITREARSNYLVIVTIFAKSVSKEISGHLLELGYDHIVDDREKVNAIIYQTCRKLKDGGTFEFDISTCHICPVPKENDSTCDIFESHIADNIATGTSLPAEGQEKLIISKLGVLVSNKCNLTCQGCNHLRDLYQKGDSIDFTKAELLGDISKIVEAVDLITQVVIVGGEAFLHGQLYEILDEVLRLPRIGIIQIITNGTVLPKDQRLYGLMANPRVIVEISGYGDKIPAALQNNVQVFMAKLESHGVNYQYMSTLQWFDFGAFGKRPYTAEQHQEIYAACCFVSNDLFNGKIHKCSRSVFAAHLEKIPDYPNDYVDVRNLSNQALKLKIKSFLANETPDVCFHCNGTSTATIEAGSQHRKNKK